MIDSLPTDWKRKKIIDIGKISTSSVDKKIDPNETEINLINYMDVYSSISKKITSDINFMRVTASDNQLLKNQVKKGDVLFTPSSETPDDIGISAVVYEELPNTLYSYHLVRLSFFENIDLDYKRYIFNSPFILNKFSRISQGLTRFTISQKDFNGTEILIPPLSEQRKIAAILSTVNDAIEKSDAIIEETKQLKKGLMQKLFSEGIGHTRFKETEIGRIPEKWELKRFIEMIVLQRGYDLPVQNRTDGPYPVVASNGIIAYHREFKEKGPGVITGRSGTLGKVHYTESNYWPHNTALFSKEMYDNHSKFLYYYLQALKLDRYGTGTGVPTLNRNVVHKVRVAVPPLEEQSQIAQILSEVDVKIKKEKATKEQLEQLKKGLMQVLLTGKVRVKV